MAPPVVLCAPRRARDLAAMSLRRPGAIFVAAPNWSEPGARHNERVTLARNGHVLRIRQRTARLILIFGARPHAVVPMSDLISHVFDMYSDGGPLDCRNAIASCVSLDRVALVKLGIRMRGLHRGWCMDAVEVAPPMQAAA